MTLQNRECTLPNLKPTASLKSHVIV